jgi:Sel1 repeat
LYYNLATAAMDIRAYDTAFEFFRKSADLNDPAAMYALGLCHENGFGCQRDTKKAIEKYTTARAAGNHEAARRLFDIEHPEVFIECAYCRGSGRVPETAVSYKNCPECGGTRGKIIRK